MGPCEKLTVTANSSSSNYAVNTDGTMTDLSVKWMLEDMNTGLQFPLETVGHPSSCPVPNHRGSHTAAPKYKYYF